jgi:hypothetical protein
MYRRREQDTSPKVGAPLETRAFGTGADCFNDETQSASPQGARRMIAMHAALRNGRIVNAE